MLWTALVMGGPALAASPDELGIYVGNPGLKVEVAAPEGLQLVHAEVDVMEFSLEDCQGGWEHWPIARVTEPLYEARLFELEESLGEWCTARLRFGAPISLELEGEQGQHFELVLDVKNAILEDGPYYLDTLSVLVVQLGTPGWISDAEPLRGAEAMEGLEQLVATGSSLRVERPDLQENPLLAAQRLEGILEAAGARDEVFTRPGVGVGALSTDVEVSPRAIDAPPQPAADPESAAPVGCRSGGAASLLLAPLLLGLRRRRRDA
jgi:hypothetical protein